MVPLQNYGFLTALNQRFHHGAAWEDTEWYNWMQRTGPSRYNTAAKIKKRVQFLDTLYAECLSGAYRMQSDDPPLINIGRQGRIALDDGRHRICIAKVAGIARISVKINAVHPEYDAGE